MKKLLMTTVAMLIGGSACATDLRLPSRNAVAPIMGCTLTACTSFYVGAGISGSGNNLDVLGNGLNGSLNANGTLGDVHVGFRTWNNRFYLGAEGVAQYDMQGGTTALGTSFSNRFAGMELFKVGGNISALLGTQSVVIPPALAPYLMSVYGVVGAKQRMGSNGMVSGAGAEFLIGPTSSVSTEYLHVTYGGGGASDIPGLAVQDENIIRLSYHYNFGSLGL